jgi:FMN reductase (NADPH)
VNKTIDLLLSHRSVRKFKDQNLTEEQIKVIVESAQAASTSSFIQAYSIIGVTDSKKKEKLAQLAGDQDYVANNGHFFVFCADLFRHTVIEDMENAKLTKTLETTEKFMVSVIDASLAAQNATIAAESMGLGICYIGGIRNHCEEVGEVLKLPKRVIPLFGLAVGVPDQHPDKKPRLPFDHIYHTNEYDSDLVRYKEQLTVYNQEISAYYRVRTNGKRSNTWTEQMANMLSYPKRDYMKKYLEERGFPLN